VTTQASSPQSILGDSVEVCLSEKGEEMNLKRLGKDAVRFSNDVRRMAMLDDRALRDVLGDRS
jgi:hypothetical protein